MAYEVIWGTIIASRIGTGVANARVRGSGSSGPRVLAPGGFDARRRYTLCRHRRRWFYR